MATAVVAVLPRMPGGELRTPSPAAADQDGPLPSRPLSGGPSGKTARRDTETKQAHRPRRHEKFLPWKLRLKEHQDSVIYVEECLDFGPGAAPAPLEAHCLVTVAADGQLRLWLHREGHQPQLRHKLLLVSPPVTPAEVARRKPGPSGNQSARLRGRGAMTVAAYDGRRPLEVAEPDSAKSSPLVFAGYEDGNIFAYDASNGCCVATLAGHEHTVALLRVCGRPCSPFDDPLTAGITSANLLSSAYDGTLRVWRCRDSHAECLCVLEFGAFNPVADLVLLPGDRLVACSWDGKLRSLDLKRKACTNATEACRGGIRSICSLPPRKQTEDFLFFVGTEDCDIACWSFPLTGPCVQKRMWKAHDGAVTALRILDVGSTSRLISASEDRCIRIWSTTSEIPLPLEEFYGHLGGIVSMAISSKDHMLWTGSRDHSVRCWSLPEAEARIRDRDAMIMADKQSMSYEKEIRAEQRAKLKAQRGKKSRGKSKTREKSVAKPRRRRRAAGEDDGKEQEDE